MFELHCTLDKITIEFKRLCSLTDVKLISIALLDENNKEIEIQNMTSVQTRFPANDWKKIKHISDICGIKILRTKLESSLHNSYKALYYETHFSAPKEFNLPKSIRKDKKDFISYTLRATTLEEFNKKYQENNIHLYSYRIEKCLLDTNVHYDGNWIST